MSAGARQHQRLSDYIAAFNRSDFEALGGFYCDDVELVIGNGRQLLGRQAILDFYRRVKASTRRTIAIIDCVTGNDLVAAELESEFLALEDVPDFASGPMRAGDQLYINSFAFYDLRGDRYARIRAAVFRREWRRRSD